MATQSALSRLIPAGVFLSGVSRPPRACVGLRPHASALNDFTDLCGVDRKMKDWKTRPSNLALSSPRPPLCSHDDLSPLLEPPPPAAAVALLSRPLRTPTDRHPRPAKGRPGAGRQGAPGRQLPPRAERRARGGAPQQHVGDRLRRRGGPQTGQRGVPRAGIPGRHHVGPQRKVRRRTR